MAKFVSSLALLGPLSLYLLSCLLLLAIPTAGCSFNALELNYTSWRNTSANATNLTLPTKDACNLTVWNRNNWNQSGINVYLPRRLAEFNKNPPPAGNDFVKNFLLPAFAPGTSPALADCSVDHESEITSGCEDFNHLEDRAEASIVQQIMKSIANLNNAFFDVIAAIDFVNTALGEASTPAVVAGGAAILETEIAVVEPMFQTFAGNMFATSNAFNLFEGFSSRNDKTDTGDIYAESTRSLAKSIRQFVTEYWYSWTINQLWDTERVWILQVDVPLESTCLNDTRGPAGAKVCLPEFTNFVFFFYALPRTGESRNKYVADLVTPPGFEKSSGDEGLHGITKQKIARSSKSYSDHFGNSRDPANLNDMADFLKKPDYSMFTAGQPGLWTIPICYDPSGGQIAQMKATDKSRVFPCHCGSHDNGPVTDDSRAQVMPAFLEATHLRFSYDYHCQCHSLQRQNCELAKGGGTLDSRYRLPMAPKVNVQDQDKCFKCFKREKNFWSIGKYKHDQCLAVYPYTDCKGAGFHW